jgi:TfoX/Sxy family transcriptional regulator of competence genes
MPFDADLATRTRRRLASRGVTERRMFGGLVFLVGGNIAAGVWKDSLLVRVGPDGGDALGEPFVGPFAPGGTPAAGWVLVEPDGVDTDDQLADWLERGLAFAETLTPK